MNERAAKLKGLALVGAIALATIVVASWPVRAPRAPDPGVLTVSSALASPAIARAPQAPTRRTVPRVRRRPASPPAAAATAASEPTVPIVVAQLEPARTRAELPEAPVLAMRRAVEFAIEPSQARDLGVSGAFRTTGGALATAFKKTGAAFRRAF